MKKLSVVGVLSIVIMSFLQCEKNSTDYEMPPADGRVIGMVQGVVQDSYTGIRLADVIIKYIFQGETRTIKTDTLGYYYVTNLNSGSYEFTFMGKENYATTKAAIIIPSVAEISHLYPSEKNYDYSVVQNIQMYKMNAGIRGQLYARDGQGDLVPAPGVKVIAQIVSLDPGLDAVVNENTNENIDGEEEVEPAVYETITDGKGEYLFNSNLPCVPYYMVYSLPFTIGNVEYETGYCENENPYISNYISVTPNSVVTARDIIADIMTTSVRLLSSPFGEDHFPITSDIQLVFSKKMDPVSFEITLTKNSGDWYSENVYFTFSWNSEYTYLTINPYDTLEYNTEYTITLDGKSFDNALFSQSGNLTTEAIESAILIESPLNQNEILVGENLEFIFSEPMNSDDFEISMRRNSSWGEDLYFDAVWSDGDTKLTIDPYVILKYGTTYYIGLSGTAQNGSAFTTSGTFVTEQIAVPETFTWIRTNLEVVDGEFTQEFPVDANIEIQFNQPINTDNSVFQLRKQGISDYIEVMLYVSTDKKTVTLNPTNNLAGDTGYIMRYEVYSESGGYCYGEISFKTLSE